MFSAKSLAWIDLPTGWSKGLPCDDLYTVSLYRDHTSPHQFCEDSPVHQPVLQSAKLKHCHVLPTRTYSWYCWWFRIPVNSPVEIPLFTRGNMFLCPSKRWLALGVSSTHPALILGSAGRRPAFGCRIRGALIVLVGGGKSTRSPLTKITGWRWGSN